jgi:prepilin-type N-terminal cleavage/methylation domain-containing protein
MRRAFSLIELIAATAIGSVVLAACLALFGLIARTDRIMEERAIEVSDLSRARFVAQRILGHLVMSDAPVPPDEDRLGEEEEQPEPEDEAAPPTGRFILHYDEQLDRMWNRARFRAGGSGYTVFRPQRLEIAAASVAVPHGDKRFTGRFTRGVSFEDSSDPGSGVGLSVVRGAFELIPDNEAALTRARATDETTTWTLIFRPMADPGSEGEARFFEDRSDEYVVRLASGLAACRWRVFKDRQYLEQFVCEWADDLPAYIQLELVTAGGQQVDWIFEVGWTVGAEAGDEESEDDLEGADEAGEAGEPGGAAGRNLPPGPRGAGSGGSASPRQPGRATPMPAVPAGSPSGGGR